MFDPDFIDRITDILADKVMARLEQRMAQHGEMSEWLNRYGLTMTREEVAQALKVSKRHLINMENRGDIERAAVPGKEVKYETAKIFSLVNKKSQYANGH